MRAEVDKQNLIMRSDLIEQVKSLKSKCDFLEVEKREYD